MTKNMSKNILKHTLLLLCALWTASSYCSEEEPDPYVHPIMNGIVYSSPAQFNQLLKTSPEAVHTRGDNNNTPLHEILIWSATLTLPETLRRARYLIKAGADVNAKNNCGDTPLHLAADRGLLKIIKLLMRHGADVNIQNKKNYVPDATALHLAVQKRQKEVAQFLLDQVDIIVDAKDTVQATPLHYAIEKGLFETVQHLVKKGASLNACTEDGRTPLHRAAISGRADVVSFLISHGADASITDNAKCTPLHLAAHADDCVPAARILLKAGCDIDAYSDKCTPLHNAVWSNNLELVEFLVSNGADIDATNKQKNTPLKIAIIKKHNCKIAHLLIARGAATDFLKTRAIIRAHMGWQGAFLLNWKEIQKEAKDQRLVAFAETGLFPLDIDRACPGIVRN